MAFSRPLTLVVAEMGALLFVAAETSSVPRCRDQGTRIVNDRAVPPVGVSVRR